MRKHIAILSCMLVLAMVLSACGGSAEPSAVTDAATQAPGEEAAGSEAASDKTEAVSEETTEAETEAVAELDPLLDLANYADKWIYVTQMPKSQRGELVYDDEGNIVYEEVQPCYALMDIPYCLNPADSQVQLLDIYIPEEYADAVDNGDETFTVSVNREGVFTRADGTSYTGANAPVVVQNTIDGYAEGERLVLTSGRKGGGVGTYNSYLESGYVLVSIGSRGITSEVDGTAPAPVVDLKAGIRMIKANADLIAGDINKIVTTGTSAGGAVASILGASGNAPEYDSYLEEIGAVMDSTDDVYSVMAFCPITNLDTADAAFEWLHSSETASKAGFGGGMMGGPGGGMMGGPEGGMMGGPGNDAGASSEPEMNEFSDFEVALHDALYNKFIEDIKSWGLDPEKFDQGFLDEINECVTYYAENYGGEQYTVEDAGAFVAENMGRSKGVPSFDGFDADKRENELFDGEHFSKELREVLESLADAYPEAGEAARQYDAQITDDKLKEVDLMTPNYFLLKGDSDIAPFWRFRTGSADGDVGAATSWTMTQIIENNNLAEVDYALIWGVGHMSADYSYEDVQTYIDSISK